MEMNNRTYSGGIDTGGLLLVLFIGLKLGHVINWSWWWVLSPLWISLGILGIVLLICGIVAVLTKKNKEGN